MVGWMKWGGAMGALAWAGAVPVSAQDTPFYIDVEKEADRRIVIGLDRYAALPAEEIGSPPDQVLAFDFELSGWFQPETAGILPPRSLNEWGRRGAEIVAELDYTTSGLRGTVRDVGTGDVLFDQVYPSGYGEALRDRLHRFSDDVVQALTGERGLARTRILCEWNPGDGKRIVLMDIDGYGMRELTGEEALEVTPRWSWDGKKAVYTSYASGYPDVYLHDLVLGNRKRIAHYEGLNASGDLSPNGNWIALTLSPQGNPEIYSKNLSSGKIRRLTVHKGTDNSAVWSPDGSRLAFVSDRTGSPQIYLMDTDGKNVERLTVRGNYNTAPEWSPEGDRIAYCALRPDGFQIQVVDVETKRAFTVTDRGGCEDPSWSPDGKSILYSRKAGGRSELYITNLNERQALRVSRGSGQFTGPSWSPFP